MEEVNNQTLGRAKAKGNPKGQEQETSHGLQLRCSYHMTQHQLLFVPGVYTRYSNSWLTEFNRPNLDYMPSSIIRKTGLITERIGGKCVKATAPEQITKKEGRKQGRRENEQKREGERKGQERLKGKEGERKEGRERGKLLSLLSAPLVNWQKQYSFIILCNSFFQILYILRKKEIPLKSES